MTFSGLACRSGPHGPWGGRGVNYSECDGGRRLRRRIALSPRGGLITCFTDETGKSGTLVLRGGLTVPTLTGHRLRSGLLRSRARVIAAFRGIVYAWERLVLRTGVFCVVLRM